MKSMTLNKPSPVETRPLRFEELDDPEPRENEVLVRVDKCGVCRTDLHVVEGDLPQLVSPIVPGHEIVGRVLGVGKSVQTLSEGDLVGIPWLHHTCGRCEYCTTGRENLCEKKTYTGYTVNGGYSTRAVGEEGYIFELPKGADPVKVAPLLCAGIIGYRAYKLALPRHGGRIGFFGFGGSAHLTLQLAIKQGYETFAYSRKRSHLNLAEKLGASKTFLTTSNKHAETKEENLLDAAIVFAPAGDVVLQALRSLKKGGTVSIAAIHMSPIREIDYDRYLFGERKIISVEANTRSDAREFLDLAMRLGLESTVTLKPLREANEALLDLKKEEVVGAFVLDCSSA